MEIVGVTRLRDNKEVDEFVVGCPEHNYWFKGKPPLVSGCRECWHAYFFAEWALGGAKKEDVEGLEAVIRHAAEAADKGEFDFKPEYDIKIEKET